MLPPPKKKKTNKAKELYIIGIGASAGGLEALYKLFTSPLPENASIVIIQHLPSDYKSNTTELLSSHTTRKVISVSHQLKIQPGEIYVMTERNDIKIKNGVFLLTPTDPSGRTRVIDKFFYSLAEDQGKKSVAIILSGSNNDGTEGAEAVKKAGGLVIAQDPLTTIFGNMPESVINTGIVDFVLAPEMMMEEITIHLHLKSISDQFTRNKGQKLTEILELIQKQTPLDFREYKRSTLIRRIIKRMVKNHFELIEDYIIYLKSNPDEVESLSSEFLISVTSFFRDPEAFRLLKETYLPEILKADSEAPVKVWSVGCATGEEAYSLAILFCEYFSEHGKRRDVKIFATDIDQKALSVASKGCYPENITSVISQERLENFFTREEKGYRIKDDIRQMIIFARHNVIKHPPYNKLDLICCRNVLIYMTRELQKKVYSIFHFALKKNGIMFLGPSESIGDQDEIFLIENKEWNFFRNTDPTGDIFNGKFTIQPAYRHHVIAYQPKGPAGNNWKDNLIEAVCEDLLKQCRFACICVDESFNIIRTFGNYKDFLIPEMFTFNLLGLLPKELSVVAATSMRKALKEKRGVAVKGINYQYDDKDRSVDLVVHNVEDGGTSHGKLLVYFRDGEQLIRQTFHEEPYDEKKITKEYLGDLETELARTREKLREANETLALSIDNAQAYNEELIATNEELQSTNEEVQSINEELQTVNHDYQETIKKLTESNDDLNNYFRSTTNSQLYIDNNLIIRKFSPQSFRQINLKPADVGRPLSDISTNIKFSTLINDIHEVMATMQIREKEVQTTDDKWYQLVITPYLTTEERRNEGVIITLNDITELKITQSKLKRIIEDHDMFIYSVSHDLKNELGNILQTSEYLHENILSEEIDRNEVTKFSGYMLDAVKNLTSIVSDLTDIAKIEKEIMTGEQEKVNIGLIIDEIRSSLQNTIKESDAIISMDLQVKEVLFMKKNLRSILHNLITNAIKYKLPGTKPEIFISTSDSPQFVILTIQDNGMGINKEKQRSIFFKYRRVHDKKAGDIEGTGIGLYLVEKIMQASGGRIEINSEEGKGSIFKVYFRKKFKNSQKAEVLASSSGLIANSDS